MCRVREIQYALSEEDIKKGSRWASELAIKLDECNFGIVCATPEAIKSTWVAYEAGAVSKILGESALTCVLFGVEPGDLLHNPLSGFQAARIERDEFFKLVVSINHRLGDDRLEKDRLCNVFSKWWSDFEHGISEWKDAEASLELVPTHKPDVPAAIERLQSQVSDLIQLSQELNRTIASPEKMLPAAYIRATLKGGGDGKHRARQRLERAFSRVDRLQYYLARDFHSISREQLRQFQNELRHLEWDLEWLGDTLELPMKFRGRRPKLTLVRELSKPSVAASNATTNAADGHQEREKVEQDSVDIGGSDND